MERSPSTLNQKSTGYVVLSILIAFVALGLIFSFALAKVESSKRTTIAIQGDGHTSAGLSSAPLDFAPDVVLVGFKPGVDAKAVLSQLTAMSFQQGLARSPLALQGSERLFPAAHKIGVGLQSVNTANLARIYRLRLQPGGDIMAAVEALRADPSVAFAEPDYLARPVVTPNDTYFGDQWGLTKIGAPGAWDVTKGDPSVTIAIVDSGLDTAHQDLSGKLWNNPGETAGNGIDDDGNGLVDDVQGWNFLEDNGDISDSIGHGTQVGGVAGAATNNSTGIAGTCWNCQLMVVRVMQTSGVVNYSDIAAGVAYAAGQGADVINLSLGGYADSETLRTAIESAATTAVIVAGAGNDNSATPFYPATYPEVVAVAGTDSADAKASFSNYGGWVDISAPGVDIKTTFSGGNAYGSESGTSLSAPFAAGLAGLLKSQHSDWSPALVRQHIANTAASIDGANPSYAGQLGSGRVNANAALSTNPQPQMRVSAWALDGQTGALPEPGSTYELVVTLENTWLPARNVVATLSESDAYISITDNNGNFGDLNTLQSGANSANPFTIQLAFNTPYNHPIQLTLNLSGDDGYTLSLPFTLSVRSGIEEVPDGAIFESDTTWTSDKTYILKGNAVVAAGVSLTVQPGTLVKVEPGSFFRIDGTLVADGTSEEPIIFTTSSITGSLWTGLRFIDSSGEAAFDVNGDYVSGSILRQVQVSYAQTGVNMLSRAPYIADSAFENNGVAIHAGSGSPRIERNTFTRNGGGVSMYGGLPKISRNTFSENDGPDAGNGIVYGSGSPTIISNTISENNLDTVIEVYGATILRNNIIVGNYGETTIVGAAGTEIENNLIANGKCGPAGCSEFDRSLDVSMDSDSAIVRYNTIINNGANGVTIRGSAADQMIIENNNWFGNGTYDVVLEASKDITVTLGANYWGDIPGYAVASRIYDCNDTPNGCGSSESTIGKVVRTGDLISPDQIAPAFVQSVSVTPDPLGIEQGTFEVVFSKPMVTDTLPVLNFHDARRGSMEAMTDEDEQVYCISEDALGRLWFCQGTNILRYDGQEWSAHSPVEFGMSNDASVNVIFHTPDGAVWFANDYGQISRLFGSNLITYSAEYSLNSIYAIGEDLMGKMWFGGGSGILSFDGFDWEYYDHLPGGELSFTDVTQIVRDGQGRMWFKPELAGVVMYDGESWTLFNQSNVFPTNSTPALFADRIGRIWVGFCDYEEDIKLGMFDGFAWSFYSHKEIGTNCITDLAEDLDGNIWVLTNSQSYLIFDGSHWTAGQEISNLESPFFIDSRGNFWMVDSNYQRLQVIWGGLDYPIVDNAAWLSSTRFRATYDVTPLVPRGTYAVEVAGAVGLDGMAIAPDDSTTFTLDYAGYVVDDTPPTEPVVTVLNDGSLTTLTITWSSDDPEGIAQYRYALGTTPGGRDVLDWTYVPNTTTSVKLNGLLLTKGQAYYATVAAQNTSGLWSESGISSPVVGGVGVLQQVYMPFVQR